MRTKLGHLVALGVLGVMIGALPSAIATHYGSCNSSDGQSDYRLHQCSPYNDHKDGADGKDSFYSESGGDAHGGGTGHDLFRGGTGDDSLTDGAGNNDDDKGCDGWGDDFMSFYDSDNNDVYWAFSGDTVALENPGQDTVNNYGPGESHSDCPIYDPRF